MSDKFSGPIGQQIRQRRRERGLTLAELAHRAGTSAPTLHRYENGWDRFEVETLRRIAAALEARLEIRLVPGARSAALGRPTASALVKMLAPLFWDRELEESDLGTYPDWVLERVLTAGNRRHVRAVRAYFGDDAIVRATRRRGVDRRTREYWRVILGEGDRASQGP
jgi:transcriptional regulator with XRE-family HTH domain